MLKNLIICLVCICLCGGVSYYSKTSYDTTFESIKTIGIIGDEIPLSVILSDSTKMISELITDKKDGDFKALSVRNPFEKKPREESKPERKITLKLPEIELPEVHVQEPELKVPEETYLYRGIFILAGTQKYVVERESDRKTFFLNRGDKTRDFIVLETSEKEVIISDLDGNIKILKVVK